MIDLRYTTIDAWPGDPTPSYRRKRGSFKASFTKTLDDLDQRLPARALVRIGKGWFNPDLVADLVWCGARFRAHPTEKKRPCHAVLPDGSEALVMPVFKC